MASGRFLVRLDPKLHRKLKADAIRKGLSLNALVSQKLSSNEFDDSAPVVDLVTQVFGSKLVGLVLFGSAARQEQKQSSDIDLLIVLNEDAKIERELYRDWENEIRSKVDSRYSPQFCKILIDLETVSSLWLEVALDGIILKDSQGRIRHLLSQVRDLISHGKYIRKFSYGQPYWVRSKKEDAE